MVCEVRSEDGTPLPAPPLTIMSISLKTRTDLRTQTNEVALVSLLMHDNVSMDSPTKDAMGRNNLTVFSTVRAIGRPGENGCLPSDYRETLQKKPGLNMTVHANERGML